MIFLALKDIFRLLGPKIKKDCFFLEIHNFFLRVVISKTRHGHQKPSYDAEVVGNGRLQPSVQLCSTSVLQILLTQE
jgi:hypothetical protein